MEKFFSKSAYTQEELLQIFQDEEKKRRREAKKREKEILALLTQQKAEWELDHKGKLYGEYSLTDLAAKVYGGEGVDYTDKEAEICSDLGQKISDRDSIVYRIPSPEKMLLLQEAMDTVDEVILPRWGEAGKELFELWLDATIATVCIENNLPAIPTLTLIKEMVIACRKYQGKKPFFPFPEEEEEIRRKRKSIKSAISVQRMLEGITQPADPKNRIYLKSEESDFSISCLVEVIKKEYGIKISHSTAARAKKTGWFMRPGYEVGKKVSLSSQDLESSRWISQKFGISQRNAVLAKKRGYFFVNPMNQKKVKILDLTDFGIRVSVKEVLAERDGFSIVDGQKSVHCSLCGKNGLPLRDATIDHIIPSSEGGYDLIENLCLAHKSCNKEKGSNISPFREPLRKLQEKIAANKGAILPAKIAKVGEKEIKDFKPKELVQLLGFSIRKAGMIIIRGFISTLTFSEAKKNDLAERIKKCERGELSLAAELPEVITELQGRKLTEFHVQELMELGFSRKTAFEIKKRGWIKVKWLREKNKKILMEAVDVK